MGAWSQRRTALLPVVVGLVAVGGGVRLVDPTFGDVAWGVAIGIVLVDLVVTSVRRVREGRVAVDVVAALALAGSVVLGELLAGAIVAVMVASGTALEQHAHRRAERELRSLLSLAPRRAHRVTDGAYEVVPVEAVAVGDVLIVRPGDVVPVDGTALDPAVLDESTLTGEARPVDHAVGDTVRSGTVNAAGAFHVRARATAADSAYAGIVSLVRSAGVDRAPFVRLADRYAVVFVPVVLALAGVTWAVTGDATRLLAVLVVATPCPLVLAAPVAIVAGISSAARHGVVVKDGGALEALADAGTVVLDKTGTLTSGRARVVGVVAAPTSDPTDVLRLAASVEQASPHVLADAVVAAAAAEGVTLSPVRDVDEHHGSAVMGTVEGHRVHVGAITSVVPGATPDWLVAAQRRARREACSTVAVAVDGAPAGVLLVVDEVRIDTPRALRAMRRAGVERIVMLSGDRLDVAVPVGRAIGVDQVFAERSPVDKVDVVRREAAAATGTTVMVGDGVNDAPALAAADLGVAIGGRGATASSEAADVVLVVDRLDRLATGIECAQRSRTVARQSVLGGMGVAVVAMAVAAVGWLPPVAGAVTQEVIDVAAVASALRALRGPRHRRPSVEVPEAWARQLAGDHARFRLLLDDVRAAAATLGELPAADARDALVALTRRLHDEVIPHEERDEGRVYPDVSSHLPGDDPLASLSRSHHEIFSLVASLDAIVEESSTGGLDSGDRHEAQRVLYALDAILRLHFAQEEELLASLT